MTLVFETFMSQTAGPEWTVGIARLNGFNGMQGMPSIGISLFGYNFEALDNKGYYVILILAILVLYFLDKLANSKFGLILSASKEDIQDGKKNITSYWRTLKSDGKINLKYPGWITFQKKTYKWKL